MIPAWRQRRTARDLGSRAFSCPAFAAALLCLWAFAAGLPAQRLDMPFLHAGVRLSTNKPAYWRYEMVEFQVDAMGGGLNPAEQPLLEVRLFKDGVPMPGLPGREACLLRWDANVQAWRGRWPIPWNPDLGEVEGRLSQPAGRGEGEARVHFSGPGITNTVQVEAGRWLARCRFSIRGRKPTMLPAGFSVVALEPGAARYRFAGPDGGMRSWQNALTWTKFVEGDAFWHCGIQTQIWGNQNPENLPWSKEHLDMVWEYAEEARRQGVPYGPYMLTFLVGGDYLRTDYDFSLSYDRRSGTLTPIRFVSLADPRRQRDITAILKRLQATPGVTYVGMDYVRANTGGLEFTDEFLADFDLSVPEGLRRASVEERRLWLGRQLADDSDRRLQHQWDWWRAHRVSLVLKGILEESGITKPVWVFSLGWKQGHQHGQDPRMLIDAGISFNAPMFYEADGQQFPAMLSDWKHYLRKTGGTLVLGQVVDRPLLHARPGLNGPEEHYRRQIEAMDLLGPSTDRLGFFWHDLNRAVAGGRSSNGGREWALAGAASFSRLREAAGALPVAVDVGLPAPALGVMNTLSGAVRVRNLTDKPLAKVRVEPVWTPGLGVVQPGSWWLKDLAPGEAREMTYTVQVTARFVRERFRAAAPNERMLAFRARAWQDPAWPRGSYAFSYWKALPYAAADPADAPTAAAGPGAAAVP